MSTAAATPTVTSTTPPTDLHVHITRFFRAPARARLRRLDRT